MVLDAIHKHWIDYGKRLPRRFEMHPRVYCDLIQSLTREEVHGSLFSDVFKLHGVEVHEHSQTIGVRMVTCNNEVEYL